MVVVSHLVLVLEVLVIVIQNGIYVLLGCDGIFLVGRTCCPILVQLLVVCFQMVV